MIDICKECNERAVHIQKYGLCERCYAALRRSGNMPTTQTPCRHTINKQKHASEMEFVKNFFTHSDWIHHPAVFYLNEVKYTPDFYDAARNVFIEVSGTRQAYQQNKEKYQLLRQVFPQIKFEVRKTDGSLLEETERIEWSVIKSG